MSDPGPDKPEDETDPAPEPGPQSEPELVLPQAPASGAKARRFGRGFWKGAALVAVLVVFAGPVLTVLVYRFVPPPITELMLANLIQGRGLDYRWRSLDDMAPALAQAAIAGEDATFCSHNGFDMNAIRKAMRNNERRPGRIRGGSTISQQTAKNVFLWPDRSYVRKGLEAYFTVLIETLWGKRRIMEVYLNVAEWGPGTYGAQAAAHRYFRKDAADLTQVEAARLVAILPSPLKWKAAAPGPYVKKRSRRIGGAMGAVRNTGLAACLG